MATTLKSSNRGDICFLSNDLPSSRILDWAAQLLSDCNAKVVRSTRGSLVHKVSRRSCNTPSIAFRVPILFQCLHGMSTFEGFVCDAASMSVGLGQYSLKYPRTLRIASSNHFDHLVFPGVDISVEPSRTSSQMDKFG